jgi:hypothetical protein
MTARELAPAHLKARRLVQVADDPRALPDQQKAVLGERGGAVVPSITPCNEVLLRII